MKVKNQEGWLAIEAMAAVMVMLISVPIFYNLWAFAKAEEEQAVVAGQLKTIGEAFEGYVQENYSALSAAATPTVASSITFATLKAGGYVQSGVSATNIWGQGYVNYVLQPKPGTLELITLTTGGTRNDTDFKNQLVPGTAVKIGSKGGYIPSGLVPGQVTTTMQGSYNGWQKSLTGTNIPTPGAGHLVYYSTTDEAAAGQDFLYRKSVPGNPQLNTMETGLNMGDNAISNVGGQTMTSGATLDMSNGAIKDAGNINSTGSISATGDITTPGTVNAGKVVAPAGNNLQVGGAYLYGDSANSAIRQSGSFHVQHVDGSAADIASVRNIASSGNITASGNVYGKSIISQGGIIYGVSNNWGMQLLDAGWGANGAPQSAVGSAYVNDIYVRSVGKWASQLASGGVYYLARCVGSGTTTCTPVCSSGGTLVSKADVSSYSYWTGIGLCKI